MHLLSIGYGRSLFDHSDPERKRLEQCAATLDSCHLIVFTLKQDGLEMQQAAHGLMLHPTRSLSKLHMVFDAVRIGLSIVRPTLKQQKWVITSQDPFEAGFAGYVIAKLTGLPLNIQEHGDFFSSTFWRRSFVLNRVRSLAGRFLLRRADAVRVVSQRIKRTMISLGVPESRILFLPVRSDSLQEQSANMNDLHATYPNASVIVLSIGRLVVQKNIPLTLKTFAVLYRKDPRALLLIVGSGDQLPHLRQLASSLQIDQAVIFLPWTDNPQDLIRTADILALSSDWEGWGRVLVEAMALGTPAVATDVGCANEIFKDGVHGFVVNIRDDEAFAQKLIALAEDKEMRERFGRQGMHDAQKVHVSLDEYAQGWRSLWDRTYQMKMHK